MNKFESNDDGMENIILRKSQAQNIRKSARSMSCYASPLSIPVVTKQQNMCPNGEVNIIDLTDDGTQKSSSNARKMTKLPSHKNENSKSRKLSKYLAKQRMSIAAIGADFLGDSGRDTLKFFGKGMSRGRDKEDSNLASKDESSEHSSESDLRSSTSSLFSRGLSERHSFEIHPGRNSVPNITFHHEDKSNHETEVQSLYDDESPFNSDDLKVYKLTNHRSSLTYSDPFDFFCKVVLLGDSGVGKTCLLMKYKDGVFLSGAYISTVGIDFRNKVINVDDSKVKLQIWDTAGQERFRSVTHAYYRDAHALLLLYDVTNKPSFDNTREWLAEVHEYAQDDVVIMLIGNKCDVPTTERHIRREDGERLAREYNVAFMETSAKTGINVDLAFTAVARDLKARKSTSILEKRFNVTDYVEKQERTDQCACSLT